MAVISGKDGSVDFDAAESEVQDWTLNNISENQAYHTNDSGTNRKRVAGVRDSNGSFTALDLPSFIEGDTGSFVGYTGQDIYTVDVIVDQIVVTTDVNTGAPVSWAVTFSGNGAIDITQGSAA
jgi:hypothetical protein